MAEYLWEKNLFQFLRDIARNKLVDFQLKEAQRYLLIIEGMDEFQKASLACSTYLVKHYEINNHYRNLMKPTDLVEIEPDVTFKFINQIKKFQNKYPNSPPTYEEFLASGYQVWLHSLRSILRPELKKTVRKIWAQISYFQNEDDFLEVWDYCVLTYGNPEMIMDKVMGTAFEIPEEFRPLD